MNVGITQSRSNVGVGQIMYGIVGPSKSNVGVIQSSLNVGVTF